MEKNWTIRGAYGDWSMTVALAPNGQPGATDEVWPDDDFASIGSHFYEVVGLHELGRIVDAK